MRETCFYCTEEITDKQMHLISFDMADTEREEILCKECYSEWLHGIKG
ncbi:hypothetical protein LIT38_11060 [Bacillus sp. CMF12]|nr:MULTISPECIES: hypothetical protein [Bacillaceae]MDF2040027.1 hypothetical protein [Cytobacillus oceanisediminis]UOE57480.1 hypothetical protein IRB79_12360 [Cytobacillus oceanisediminis]USK51939.1 hypothetical protein LIT38_11060 [Bacillus sp. CMF12]